MEEWKEYKISEVIDEISMGPFGSDVKKEVYVESGVPILNGSNLQGFKLQEDSFGYLTEEKADSLKKSNAKRGDVIVTHRGTLGQIVYIPEDSKYTRYVISQSQFRFSCKTDIVRPDYLTYYFHTPIGQYKLLSNASQVGVPALARATSTFRTLDVDLPSIECQNKIMAILLSLDDKIAVNRRICENLEAQAQALFKNWFVDFAPFKNGKFVESELGMIPEGWRVGRLGEVADITSGKRPPKKSKELNDECNIPLIGAADIMGYTSSILYKSPILIIGRVGTHGVVQRWKDACWPSDNTLVIESQYYNFTYQQLKNIDYSSINRGSTQPLITQTDVKNTSIIIPTRQTLEKYESIINILYDSIYRNNKESARLVSLRDTLLPKLMSGEIKI